MIQTEQFIEFNNQAATTAKNFWDKFQNVQTHLDRLSKYMSKREFITLACKLKAGNDEGLYGKVLAVSQRIESMHGQAESILIDGFSNPVAKLRFYFGVSMFYATHFDQVGNAVGWGCLNATEFEYGSMPQDILTHDSFKIDFDFEPMSVYQAMRLEDGEV
jgi:hypothetical protein